MTITAISPEGYSNVIFNVTEVKACTDGRFLITHDVTCEHCGQTHAYVWQIPKGYFIAQGEVALPKEFSTAEGPFK